MRNGVLEGWRSRGIGSGLWALGKTGGERNAELVGEVNSDFGGGVERLSEAWQGEAGGRKAAQRTFVIHIALPSTPQSIV